VHRNCESSANNEMQGTAAPPGVVFSFMVFSVGRLPLISGVSIKVKEVLS